VSPERNGSNSSSEGARQETGQQLEQRQNKSPRWRGFPWLLGGALVLVGIAVLAYYFLYGQYHVKTKDAYVQGDLIRIAPQVSGTVTGIAADETQYVRQGGLLVRLDPSNADVTLARAEANLAETVREVVHLFDADRQAQAAVARAEAQQHLAARTLRRDHSTDARAVAKLQIDHDEAALRNAQGALNEARAQLASAQSAIAGTTPTTHPQVLLAEASLRAAWLARQRTDVLAPVPGYIVRRTVQLGEQVSPGTDMLAMAPLGSVWVDANFKETQLAKLRIGQPVSLTADSYGRHYRFHGRVLGLAGGTGEALAVLPPENATGNWIKIVQRVPVRIGLDPRELQAHPLFLGLSMNVDVDIHQTSGASLSKTPAWPAAMQTNVYASQDAGVAPLIRRILNENLGNPPARAASAPAASAPAASIPPASAPAAPRTARAAP
jgi:membrane fusion protein (multidrug efflux system)